MGTHERTTIYWLVAGAQLFELSFVQSNRHLSRHQISPSLSSLFFLLVLVSWCTKSDRHQDDDCSRSFDMTSHRVIAINSWVF